MEFTEYIDLAAERLGGRVLAANDEFFAPKENLLTASAPIWIEDKYTDLGKWMDGWETRRRRTPGYDWCIVKLGLPGVIHGVVVDTAYFKGNFPEQCELEACAVDGNPSLAQLDDHATKWFSLLPKSALAGDSKNPFPIAQSSRVTHLRFKIYPDGGVARLIHGEAIPDWPALNRAGGCSGLSVTNVRSPRKIAIIAATDSGRLLWTTATRPPAPHPAAVSSLSIASTRTRMSPQVTQRPSCWTIGAPSSASHNRPSALRMFVMGVPDSSGRALEPLLPMDLLR